MNGNIATDILSAISPAIAELFKAIGLELEI